MKQTKAHNLSALILGAAMLAAASIGLGSCSANPDSSEKTYSLKFGKDFKPLLASRDDLGISVVIAMDVSGSMSESPKSGGRAKYIQATVALGEVVDLLGRLVRDAPKDQVLKVGILKFNDAVGEVVPLTLMDPSGISTLRQIATDSSNFQPNGQTAIGAAIERGVEWLSQSGTILRSLIVITDGENTTGIPPAFALSATFNNRNSAGTKDIPVQTGSILVSFIGFDIGSGVFEPLAAYGPRITSATNQAELAASLSGLLEADITKLEAPALGAPR